LLYTNFVRERMLADERRRNNQEIDAVYRELQKLKDEIERLKSGS
jgi:hypothetical protein